MEHNGMPRKRIYGGHIVVILICWLEVDEEGHCEHTTIRYSGLKQSVLTGQVADLASQLEKSPRRLYSCICICSCL